MARRTLTLRRLDPWSVLKFGFIVNVCLLAVTLLGFVILWFVIRQLGLIDQACDLAIDVGFEDCSVDGAALFRALAVVGVLGTVIATGIYVFASFLHNLIADLVGGITYSVVEEGAPDRGGARVQRAGSEGDRGPRRDAETSRRQRHYDGGDSGLGTVPDDNRAWSSKHREGDQGGRGDRSSANGDGRAQRAEVQGSGEGGSGGGEEQAATQRQGAGSGESEGATRTQAVETRDDRSSGGLRPWEQGTQRVEDAEGDEQ